MALTTNSTNVTGYLRPTKDLVPELMFLGELSFEDVLLADGRSFKVHVITYKGEKYVMKQEKGERWFDKRGSGAESPFGADERNYEYNANAFKL